MKAQEIRLHLKSIVDPRLLKCLESQAEEISALKLQMLELAKMMHQMADNHAKLFHAASKLQDAVSSTRLKKQLDDVKEDIADEKYENAKKRQFDS